MPTNTRVHYEGPGGNAAAGVATIGLDDGKANALQDALFENLHRALDRAEDPGVHSVVMIGRPGFFSAGLDLKLLPTLGPEELAGTTMRFAEAMRRVYLFPKPIVAAATGHAIAGGMMLYLAADLRLAIDSDSIRLGLNEATTGIPLLGGTAGLCRNAIPPAHHTELILHGRMVSPAESLSRGITDELVRDPDALRARAMARASGLADIDLAAYALNKRILRERAWREATETANALVGEAPTENVFARIRR